MTRGGLVTLIPNSYCFMDLISGNENIALWGLLSVLSWNHLAEHLVDSLCLTAVVVVNVGFVSRID